MASDTVVVSHAAFKGMTFPHTGTTKITWTAHFTDRTAYLAAKRKAQAAQLTDLQRGLAIDLVRQRQSSAIDAAHFPVGAFPQLLV